MWKTSEKMGIEVRTPIHDEINVVCTQDVLDNKEDIMCKLQLIVKEKLSLDVKFKVEDYSMSAEETQQVENHSKFLKNDEDNMSKVETMSWPEDSRPEEITTNPDILHGNRLYEIFKNTSFDSKLLGQYMYDENTGLWCNAEKDFTRIVVNQHRKKSIFTAMKWDSDKKEYVYVLTKNVSDMLKPAMKMFWTLVQNGTLDCNNSIGFLLFDNGVLDCYNMKMVDFDPKYHFTKKINRNFSPENVNKELSNEILEKLFTTAYTKGDGDFEKRDYFLEKNSNWYMARWGR